MFSMTHRTAHSHSNTQPLYLEEEGRDYISRISAAAADTPWGVSFLQTAWTAGPVTFLAVHGGSLLVHGNAAPMKNFYYFAAYTVIMGLIAVVVTFLSNLRQRTKQKNRHHHLSLALERLPDLIFATQNLATRQLPREQRNVYAAYYLLKNTHAPSESIRLAVLELTEDEELANQAAHVETLRRAGLTYCARDIISQYKEKIAAIITSLTPSYPQTAKLLEQRLNGLAPSLKDGIRREAGFIDRALKAGEDGDMRLLSLRDAEEVFILAFEFLCGRDIPMLRFRYHGRRQLNKLSSEIENMRSAYRATLAGLTSRFRTLQRIILDDTTIENASYAEQLQAIKAWINQEQQTLHQAMEKNRRPNRALRQRLRTFHYCVKLWAQMHQSRKRLQPQEEKLDKLLKRWHKATQHTNLKLQTHGKYHRGLRLTESSIALNDQQKMTLAEKLTEHFNILDIMRSHRMIVTQEEGSQTPLDEEAVKELAVEVILALEPLLSLGKPTIQYAIESANATNFGSLEFGLSAMAKTHWGTAMARETQKDMSKAAEKIAHVIVHHYGEDLHDDAIEFLHQTYNADKDTLQTIATTPRAEHANEFKQHHLLPKVDETPRSWKQLYERTKTLA